MQETIDCIREKRLAKRIVAMTHIGYDEDMEPRPKHLRSIPHHRGHSHTPLGNFTGALGPYPTIEENLEGEEVFVVTAYRRGEYLGAPDVSFDDKGRIVKYTGAPIHMTNTTAVDAKFQAQVREWDRSSERPTFSSTKALARLADATSVTSFQTPCNGTVEPTPTPLSPMLVDSAPRSMLEISHSVMTPHHHALRERSRRSHLHLG